MATIKAGASASPIPLNSERLRDEIFSSWTKGSLTSLVEMDFPLWLPKASTSRWSSPRNTLRIKKCKCLNLRKELWMLTQEVWRKDIKHLTLIKFTSRIPKYSCLISRALKTDRLCRETFKIKWVLYLVRKITNRWWTLQGIEPHSSSKMKNYRIIKHKVVPWAST